MTTRNSRSASNKVSTRQRNAKVGVSVLQQPVPRLPHERDESADSQAGKPSKVIENAAADLQRGQKDTDGGAQMNKTYQKLKAGR